MAQAFFVSPGLISTSPDIFDPRWASSGVARQGALRVALTASLRGWASRWGSARKAKRSPGGFNRYILWSHTLAPTRCCGILVGMDLAIVIPGALGVLAALFMSLRALTYASSNSPAHINASLNALRIEVADFKTKEIAQRVEVDSVLEAVTTVLGQVERKRKTIAASESRMNLDTEPEDQAPSIQLMTREQLAAHASRTGQ